MTCTHRKNISTGSIVRRCWPGGSTFARALGALRTSRRAWAHLRCCQIFDALTLALLAVATLALLATLYAASATAQAEYFRIFHAAFRLAVVGLLVARCYQIFRLLRNEAQSIVPAPQAVVCQAATELAPETNRLG